MWILDVTHRGGSVGFWVPGAAEPAFCVAAPPSFHLHLPDPHAFAEMIEALEARYPVEECTFFTLSGPLEGYRIAAGRDVAEAIERQTQFSAHLYDVDVRTDHYVMAKRGASPCMLPGESRWAPDVSIPVSPLTLRVGDNPFRDHEITTVTVSDGRDEVISGRERTVLADLFSLVASHDPDVILFPHADRWMHHLASWSRDEGCSMPFSRSGRFRRLQDKSYWSYGRVDYRPGALIPEGRVLIDTEQSFVYRAGGLDGVIFASRLSGIPPNLASRFTPGTLISGYEVYEAVRRGIAVPFRKRDPERLRRFGALRAADKGGMIFQPEPGAVGRVFQLDFTSLYPTIIVRYNLSPETLDRPVRRGFLADVLAPLIDLRLQTKRLRHADPSYAGVDAVLKWMLVTCFGYTGYRNAKFGRIEVHERITGLAREILMRTKEIAECMGFSVLHGIVDCLWVRGDEVVRLKERIEREIGILTELETYDWLVFLPLADGSGAYNRYFGRLAGGEVRMRGLTARRGDAPAYVRRMQEEMLEVMSRAAKPEELPALEPMVKGVYERYCSCLPDAPPSDLAVRRRISRLKYSRNCLEASAVEAYRRRGIGISPGMAVSFVVRDAGRWIVDPDWEAGAVDLGYYSRLLARAWEEVGYAFAGSAGK